MKIEKKMKEMKLPLIDRLTAQGLYLPAIKTGNLVITSGQLPMQDQRLVYPGRVGKEVSIENAQRAARVAIVNCLSAVRHVLGDLDKVKKIIRLNGFVCSALTFNDQPRVMNAASELLIELFGDEIGAHTRTAIGVFELPAGSCVEVDLCIEA